MQSLTRVFGASGLLVAALFFAPAGAHAAVTIGAPDVDVTTGVGSSGCSPECSFVSVADPEVSYTAPADGVIVRWRVRAGGGPVFLRVLERVPATSPPRYILKGTGPMLNRGLFAPTDPAGIQNVRIPIEAGDFIAVTAVFPAQLASAPVAGAPPDTMVAHTTNNPLVEGENEFTGSSSGTRQLYNADIEPDTDRDGFGDETQDGCPTSGSFTGPCPAGPASLREIRVTRGGKRLLVEVDCPAGRPAPCKGSLFARSSKRLRLSSRSPGKAILFFGEGEFSVPPGQTEELRFRLSKTERKLVRRRKVGVTMIVIEEGFSPARFTESVKAKKG